MEQKHTQFADLSAHIRPQVPVSVLHCRQTAHLDPSPVDHIFAVKGQAEAEEMICRVLEDIAHRLDALQVAMVEHAFERIAKPARRITQVASQIGLTDVSRTASHVATAAQQADGVALSATMARLERGFDVAVTEIWTFRDRCPN
ncbi:MAG: hypothetical protein KC448_10180 [Yoonia sp.]|nr:hypothetical protein [Yoonia sp.]